MGAVAFAFTAPLKMHRTANRQGCRRDALYSTAFRLSFILVFTIFGLSNSVTSRVKPNTMTGTSSHMNQLTPPTVPNPMVLKTNVASPIPTG